MSTGKATVIYTRFTDPKQRDESLTAQEAKARQCLDRESLDHSKALILAEAAERGDLECREKYNRLVEMIHRGEVGVLCVDQLSRFSRGWNVGGLIQDLVFTGGRFIAVGDGIDTIRPWEDLVGLKEIQNRAEIRNTGWRVRRSQETRAATKNGSAGDYPYGYRSEYDDPQAALAYHGRGPKPIKHIVIDEASAAIVREVHRRFDRGESICSIVRWWQSIKHTMPRIGKGDIHHQHVRRILSNKKYDGHWVFGRTSTVRNQRGKKKQVLQHDKTIVTTERPDLRIIEHELFLRNQERLARLRAVYGMRDGHKKRGPAEYYRLLYAKRPVDGIIFCSACGSRLITASSGQKKALGCPKHQAGACAMTARVPYAKAQSEILKLVEELLRSAPEWSDRCVAEMTAAIERSGKVVPNELRAVQSQLDDIETQLSNLVDALSKGIRSPAIQKRIDELEAAKGPLLRALEDLQTTQQAQLVMPDATWVRQQLSSIGHHLHQQMPQTAQVIRAMLGKIIAEEIKPPGKRRGYIRLRFRIDGWEALSHVLKGKLPESILKIIKPADGDKTEEFVVDLGAPTRLDELAPKIAAMRAAGVKWHDIARQTGLGLGNAYTAYSRWRKDQDRAA